MLGLVHSSYLGMKRSWFLIFVVALAFFGAFLSTWMYVLFFYEQNPQWFLKPIFFIFCGALGVGKFLFGLVAVFAQAASERKLRKFVMVVFLLLSTISFIVGFSIFDQAFKSQKAEIDNSCKIRKNVNDLIETRRSIVESLILRQKIDLENNYRTRANSLDPKIKEEQAEIEKLIKYKQEIEKSDLAFPAIFGVLNFLIPFGHAVWQKIIAVLFGSMFEIASIFFLYLIFDLSKESVPFGNNVIFIDRFRRR
jgi:hypothetical protein